ncbi:hypothetical protein HY311_02850 [Candidatus Nomurabacteria bacterium]|nr:hypothetical protein [Candidatus Nomurabacteria bacterium]
MSPQEAYNELALYTLSKGDSNFIHQYIVDAFCAQNANENTKPVAITFALVGLYLHLEKNYTGREVQLAHIKLAEKRKEWIKFDIPKDTGGIIVFDVLKAKEGDDRDNMINKWSVSVWQAYKGSHSKVANCVRTVLAQL